MTAKVISFENERAKRAAQLPKNTERKKKPGESWKVGDLEGKRPEGHPPIRRGPRGGLILAEGQVWVEVHTRRLVVLERFEVRRSSGTYRHQVWIRPYKTRADYFLKELAEASFRGSFQVWDDFVEAMPRLMEEFIRAAATDPESPFRGMQDPAAAARKFFGLDEKGNRID